MIKKSIQMIEERNFNMNKWYRIDFKYEVSNEGYGGLCNSEGKHTAWRFCFIKSSTKKKARNIFEKHHMGELTRITQTDFVPTYGIICQS